MSGTANPAASVQNMSVKHRRAHVVVAQFLDRSDIVNQAKRVVSPSGERGGE